MFGAEPNGARSSTTLFPVHVGLATPRRTRAILPVSPTSGHLGGRVRRGTADSRTRGLLPTRAEAVSPMVRACLAHSTRISMMGAATPGHLPVRGCELSTVRGRFRVIRFCQRPRFIITAFNIISLPTVLITIDVARKKPLWSVAGLHARRRAQIRERLHGTSLAQLLDKEFSQVSLDPLRLLGPPGPVTSRHGLGRYGEHRPTGAYGTEPRRGSAVGAEAGRVARGCSDKATDVRQNTGQSGSPRQHARLPIGPEQSHVESVFEIDPRNFLPLDDVIMAPRGPGDY